MKVQYTKVAVAYCRGNGVYSDRGAPPKRTPRTLYVKVAGVIYHTRHLNTGKPRT